MRRPLLFLLLLVATALAVALGAPDGSVDLSSTSPPTATSTQPNEADRVETEGSTTVGVNKRTGVQTIVLQDTNTLKASKPSWKRRSFHSELEEGRKKHHRKVSVIHSRLDEARSREDTLKREQQSQALHQFHMQKLEQRQKRVDEEKAKVSATLAARHRAVVAETQEAQMKRALHKKELEDRALEERRVEEEDKRKAAFARHEEQAAKREDEQERKSSQVALSRDYRAYGHGYSEPRLVRSGTLCKMQGLLRGGAGHVGVVGKECAPKEGRLVFTVAQDDRQVRLDVLSDGRMYWIPRTGGSRRASWISLDGLVLDSVHRGRPHPRFEYGWASYARDFRPAQVSQLAGVCVVSVMARGTRWGRVGSVPEACRPADGTLVALANNHEGVTRIDILPDGGMVYREGARNHGWFSLQLPYTSTGGNWMDLTGPWYHYGHGYRPVMWVRRGPLCILSGLLRCNAAAWTPEIARLPDLCRPHGRAVFSALAAGANFCRVDVLPNGVVQWVNCPKRTGWLSLTGISFVAKE